MPHLQIKEENHSYSLKHQQLASLPYQLNKKYQLINKEMSSFFCRVVWLLYVQT